MEDLRTEEDIEGHRGGIRRRTILQSAGGFGPVTSSYLTAMIIDIDRFDSPAAFAAYFGLGLVMK